MLNDLLYPSSTQIKPSSSAETAQTFMSTSTTTWLNTDWCINLQENFLGEDYDDLYHCTSSITCSVGGGYLGYAPCLHIITPSFTHNFLTNLAYKQTCGNTTLRHPFGEGSGNSCSTQRIRCRQLNKLIRLTKLDLQQKALSKSACKNAAATNGICKLCIIYTIICS